MIKMVFVSLVLCLSNIVFGQIKSAQDTIGDDSYSDRRTYQIVQVMPLFEGKFSIPTTFIQEKMTYPEDAKASNIQGEVHISFIVNQLGDIDSISVQPYYNVWPSLDQEAMRIVSLTKGKWSIGKQSGKWVNVKLFANIKFYLPDQKLGLIKSANVMSDEEKQAHAYYDQGKFKKALQAFTSIVAKESDDNFALHNLGLCKYQTGDKGGACEDWTKLLDKGSNTAHYLYLEYCRPEKLKAFINGRYISQ